MGKSVSKNLTQTEALFEKLSVEISATLAPRLLGLLKEFGYDTATSFSFNNNNTVLIKDLVDIAKPNSEYWKKSSVMGYAGYNSNNNVVVKHTHILTTYKKLRAATEHLMKLRNEIDRSIEWIDNIGTVGNRKLLTEKMVPEFKKGLRKIGHTVRVNRVIGVGRPNN